ncbi:MAG TPA: hypothetical protein VLJ59_16665 [Mycobacteriales bacterium]|nr:hypothetical protein [Mycobacteriales bacterium]
MLGDDAQRIAAAIEDLVNPSAGAGRKVNATVVAHQSRPGTVAVGAGRPTFTTYQVRVNDGTQAATLDLGQAAELLEEMEPGWDPERLFAAIRAGGVQVEEAG